MGTRSLTYVYSEGKPVSCMYRQFDSYISGHGFELAKFLSSKKIVNGFTLDQKDSKKYANGMGCLAAQMIAHFKKSIGGFYMMPISITEDESSDSDYDFVYHVFEDKVLVLSYGEKIFSGSWKEFKQYCAEQTVTS